MTLVCEGCFKEKPEGFFLDPMLKSNLDILLKAITKDNDFVLLVSGSGQVRVGKSVLAMQVGAYLTDAINKAEGIGNTFTTDNFVFRGTELVKKAKDLPKYSCLVYDEAGADLLGRKVMHQATQSVLDFFRECGQLNLFLIIVLPDFFDLPKGIAITRSTFLLDVDYAEKFNRGRFRLYGPRNKKMLYLIGKRYLDYDAVKPDYPNGSFTNFYPIDESRYRDLKLSALTGRKIEELNRQNLKELKAISQRNAFAYYVIDVLKMKQRQVAIAINERDETIATWRQTHLLNHPNLRDISLNSVT